MSDGSQDVIAEYKMRKDDSGFWLVIYVNGDPYEQVGPFDTELEFDAALRDLLKMTRAHGAEDLPLRGQTH